jgi:hypothetical protein
VLETLEREAANAERQIPKTEDKKTEIFNVNFKAEDHPDKEMDNKESIEIIDDGKIIRGNTTEDVVIPSTTGERKPLNHHNIKRIFGCC